MSEICSIEGCTNPVLRMGWCNAHFCRWKRGGNPLGKRRMRFEASNWLEAHVNHEERNECLKWPFNYYTNNGYGIVNYKGFTTSASRTMCILAHGDPPFPKARAMHTCHKGHEGCVNPNHLKWGTNSDNQMDRVENNTSNRGEGSPMSKLTKEKVHEIRRRLRNGEREMDIAKIFGVSNACIHDIRKKRRWGWLEEEI